jgi:hypothetical protein
MLNLLRYKVARALRKLGIGLGDSPKLREMQAAITRAGGINFRVEVTDSGEWVAESTNIDGIITGGSNYPHDVNEKIEDAIFTYYEVPPEACIEGSIKNSGALSRVEERVYA